MDSAFDFAPPASQVTRFSTKTGSSSTLHRGPGTRAPRTRSDSSPSPGEFETGRNRRGMNSGPTLLSPVKSSQSDRDIARIVLREDIGRACAARGGWPGTPHQPRQRAVEARAAVLLGFHQDALYYRWGCAGPSGYPPVALDATTENGGTLELVRGSHRWGLWDI